MGHRIYITGSGIAEEAQQLLREEDCAFAAGNPKDTPGDIAGELAMFRPDGIIVRQGKITAEVMDAAATLRVICKHGVGTDNIDLAAATRRGIPVLYTPQANYESVAEHTLTLILSLIRRIPLEDKRVRAGIFDKKNYDGRELLGKTLGIIGFGRVGRRLAELVVPFRMEVVAYDPFWPAATPPSHVVRVEEAEDVFSRADIITLHCPLTPDTRNLINARSIARMKQGVCIVNTARGGIVNEGDLIRALQDQRVGGAALDVFEVEPPAGDHPLLQLSNVIFTSHVAGSSDNSMKNMGVESVRNVLTVLRGHPPDRESLVNPEVLDVSGDR